MLFGLLFHKFRCFVLCGLVLIISTSHLAAAAPQVLVIPPWGIGANQQNTYFHQLLSLVFEKTEAEEGAVVLKTYPENMSGARFMADIKNNMTVDIVWNGTTRQREQELLPIPISLLKELNEYRVLLIRKEDQERFSKVNSLEDLRQFTAGAVADWPSAEILRANQLPLVTVNNTNLLFPMLKAKRFDYISRNLSEVCDEARAFEKEGLVIEGTLALHGGVPFYFFVNKDKPKLAARIERGLQIALADGSFDKLFLSQEGFRQGRELLVDPRRKIIELKK